MKLKSVFVCSECGCESAKWEGKCPSCGSWNTLVEEVRSEQTSSAVAARSVTVREPQRLFSVSSDSYPRLSTGIGELDRVLGGGIVAGSLVLLGGDPGIGKSTILLQMCNNLGTDKKVLYVSGEESSNQIKLRADRLGVKDGGIYIQNETDLSVIVRQLESFKPDIAVIDSIQTVSHPELSSSIGSVSQVRECTNILMRSAKSLGIPIFIVSHVNKDGAIAGPKVMEHIVDVVLYFEGERNLNYRILRTIKNRFGSTNEIGVFEMCENGLMQVENPSAALLSGRPKNVSGSCVGCIVEGSRPILSEVQALVSRASYGNARRMCAGFDYNRCSMLIAVLEKRCRLGFSEFDTYVNVVGGLKMDEPASDLTVCMALASGLTDVPISDDVIAFGEVGLAGELRSVNNITMRLSEAARLGFKKCILPIKNFESVNKNPPAGMTLCPASTLPSALKYCITQK